MSPTILVTGGTGTLGREVVAALIQRGATVRIVGRSPAPGTLPAGTDYVALDLSRDSLAPALAGIETIVHCTSTPGRDDVITQRLVEAAAAAGIAHLVYPSVVGADLVPVAGWFDRSMFGYFAAKARAEQVVAKARVPWSILRATQFHQSLVNVAGTLAKLPVVPVVSGLLLQPVDVREAAARLADLALAGPSGRTRDVAGPQVVTMDALMRSYLPSKRRHRPILPIALPGKATKACVNGAIVAGAGADTAGPGWDEFLRTQEPSRTV